MTCRRMGALAAIILMHAGMMWAVLPNDAMPQAKASMAPVLETVIVHEAKPPPAAAPVQPAPSAPPAKPRPVMAKPKPAPLKPSAEPSAVTAPLEAPVAPATATEPAAVSPEPRTAPLRQPAVIACTAPIYPPESRRAKETGTVGLRLLINVEGEVVDKRVEISSGFPRLDEAALIALAKCRFQPGSVDGRSEPTWARLRYRWTLE